MIALFLSNNAPNQGLIRVDSNLGETTKVFVSNCYFDSNNYDYLCYLVNSYVYIRDCKFTNNEITANTDNYTIFGSKVFPIELFHLSTFECVAEQYLIGDKIYFITCNTDNAYTYSILLLFIVILY